jgi:hypothetical protein
MPTEPIVAKRAVIERLLHEAETALPELARRFKENPDKKTLAAAMNVMRVMQRCEALLGLPARAAKLMQELIPLN